MANWENLDNIYNKSLITTYQQENINGERGKKAIHKRTNPTRQ